MLTHQAAETALYIHTLCMTDGRTRRLVWSDSGVAVSAAGCNASRVGGFDSWQQASPCACACSPLFGVCAVSVRVTNPTCQACLVLAIELLYRSDFQCSIARQWLHVSKGQ